MIYLASPYTCDDSDKMIVNNVQGERYRFALWAAACIMRDVGPCFSPIAHSHPIAMTFELPADFNWYGYDDWYLDRCNRVYVLQLDGWKESKGVQYEIERSIAHNIPITYCKFVGDRLRCSDEPIE